jgi:N-acetylmuramoyl-L-alanine amidase
VAPSEELTAQGDPSPFWRASSTSATDRLKRKILREVVTENVESAHGHPRGYLDRRRHRRLAALRRALVGVAAAAAVTAIAGFWVVLQGLAAAGSNPSGRRITVRPLSWSDAAADPAALAQSLAERMAVGDRRSLMTDVLPLEVRRVALDPGHGGRDPGTSLGYGLVEKDLTLDIARRLQRLLVAGSCEAVLTRDGDDSVSLRERASRANASRADLFVSIHINWLPARNVRGIETYYLGPTDDPFLKRLAADENRDSGYSMADYRGLLEGIYADVRQEESRRLAEGVQRALFDAFRSENPLVSTRRVMTAPFVVLVATEMPAILAEVACMSNDREARQLAIPAHRESIAAALFDGISRYSEAVSRPRLEGEKGS